MTFEEKFAEQGRKLDETKAEIDETKAKIDDAVNDMKIQRQTDREQFMADMAELDAELNAELDALDAALDAKVNAQLDKVDAALDEAADKVDASIAKGKEKMEKVKDFLNTDVTEIGAKIQKAIDDQVEGDINAAEENVRLMRERADSKRNAVRLRAQMNVENAKAKIAARREAIDKAEQEAWILDLVDYAERCQQLALSWAVEAEYTLMEIAYEINDYLEKYGDKEE